MAELPPFDAEATCVKCAWEDVRVLHCASRTYSSYDLCYEIGQREPYEDHFHRTCGRCHYEWLEAPLDAQAAPGEARPGAAEGGT